MNAMNPVGKTKTQGWEIGVRRTFPIGTDKAWKLLTTQPGLGIWLGKGVDLTFKKGDTYETTDGTSGDIRSYSAGSLIRLTWQPRGQAMPSTLQIRVLPAKTGATISVHHEKLESGEARKAMREHWSAVLDRLGKLVDNR
jgi:uncharacterized protein YndB with AHSA1/START domain